MRGTVHVTVLDPSGTGAAASGANVVFIDPDGTLVKRTATDTMGKTSADVLPGASVTSVILNGTQYQMQTVLAVKPGDDLIVGTKNADTTPAGTFTVSFPTLVNAATYRVVGPCGVVSVAQSPTGAAPPPAVLTFTNACKQDMMEIIVIASDAKDTPIGVLNKPNVAFMNGSSTTVTGTYQAPRSLTSSYTNINAMITTLLMRRNVPDGFGFENDVTMTPPTATTVLTLPAPSSGSSALIDTQASISPRSTQLIRQRIAGNAFSYGLDLGATLLPWFGALSFDAATGKLVVPTDATGTSNAHPDFVRLVASYSRTDPDSGVTTSFAWTVWSPGVSDITLPVLPAEVGDVMPKAADTVRITAIMLESDAIASYDAIRNDLSGALVLYGSSRPPGTTLRAGIFNPLARQ